METEKPNNPPVRKTTFLILAIVCASFIAYYFVMSMLAPAHKLEEMKIESKPGMVGFSWGIGIKVSKFRISYGRSVFHLAGGTNQFSFSMNLDEFSKKF